MKKISIYKDKYGVIRPNWPERNISDNEIDNVLIVVINAKLETTYKID